MKGVVMCRPFGGKRDSAFGDSRNVMGTGQAREENLVSQRRTSAFGNTAAAVADVHRETVDVQLVDDVFGSRRGTRENPN